MTFFKTDLPKLLSKKALQEIIMLEHSSNGHKAEEVEEAPPLISLPEGILCYFQVNQGQQVLVMAALELLEMSLSLLEQIQGATKDGKSGIPFQLFPHFEQEEKQIGFRLVAEAKTLERASKLIQKMQGHLDLLSNRKATPFLIPPSWALSYSKLLQRLKQYRQSTTFVDSENGEILLDLSWETADALLLELKPILQSKKKQILKGQITGFSQYHNLIEFQVESKHWNGIKTQKAVARFIQCHANQAMIDFAKKYLDQSVEFEASLSLDKEGKNQYQLHTILIKTSKGIIKERIIYEGPQGGQYYLNYMGKRVYLPKAKRS